MTSTILQRLPSDRRFEFSSKALPDDSFAVVRMSGFEAISRPYRFELVLVSDDAGIDLARVLAANAELRILAPDDAAQVTPYAGMLAEFDQLHQAGGFTFYRAVLVPRLWQLSLYRNSEVYLHEQTIPEIVESLLKGAKLHPASDYTFKLRGDYRPRSYVCQYQETPLAFISRWLEREGIYYYFEQTDGVDRLVLLDDKVAQPAAALAVNYRPADALDVGLAPDSVQGFVCRTRPLPRSLVLQDYNHRRASMPLVAQAEVSASGLGEEMLYGENFRTEEEGQRYATIRAEELRCGGRVFSGEATAVGLRSGHFMALSHHYREDFNGRYLVTEITHEGSQAGALLAGLKTPFNERDEQTVYRNSFVALPSATQFRPARSTPKPRVAGTMSATIDAEGSGDYAELDAHGQYKVQIPFDRTDKGAAKGSAPVRMASPYAGSEHGMHFPLHKGTEVLLSFADGDPDQPVILGAVPNSVTPNVVDQRNPHDNLISTKGGNQMLMSDVKGKEVIWLNSPFHKSSIGVGSVHPEGGGSIYEATSGGKDSVSFGNSNSMSFGPANSLSLGTKASIGAAFSNDVSLGTKIGIDASSSISWKANLGRLPNIHGLKNVSIDDSKSVKLSRSFGGTSTDTAEIKAGAFKHEETTAELDSALMKLRAMIVGYTALNFAQSTVLGMAVNGSANNFFLGPKEEQAKKDQDADDLRFADAEAKSKTAEKDSLKLKEPPAEVKAEAIKGAADALAWRQAEEQKITDKYKTDTGAPQESLAEATERNKLKDQSPPADIARRVDAEAVWRLTQEKAIDDKYKNRAAEQAAASNPRRKSLQGWPGIIGKFGLDAVSNVTALALLQWYGRTLEAKIDKLKLVSVMKLGTNGIQQVVNGDSAPSAKAWAKQGMLDTLRTEFSMNPLDGVSLKVAKKTDDWTDSKALSGGSINLHSNNIGLNAALFINAHAPDGGFRTEPAMGTGAYAGMNFTSGADSATLRSVGGAEVTAAAKALKLSGDTVEVGYRAPAPNPAQVQAVAAAEKAVRLAKTVQAQLESKVSDAVANFAAYQPLGDDDPISQSLAATVAAGDDLVEGAVREVQAANLRLADANAWALSAATGLAGPMLHGLRITQEDASLVFGAAGWKASHTGLALNFNDASASFGPVGVTVGGKLIKLG